MPDLNSKKEKTKAQEGKKFKDLYEDIVEDQFKSDESDENDRIKNQKLERLVDIAMIP